MKKQLEIGLYRKPCGCQILIGHNRAIISETRCAEEGAKKLGLAALVREPEWDDDSDNDLPF